MVPPQRYPMSSQCAEKRGNNVASNRRPGNDIQHTAVSSIPIGRNDLRALLQKHPSDGFPSGANICKCALLPQAVARSLKA
jgi:hypothetical protein